MKLDLVLNDEDLRLLEFVSGHSRDQLADRPQAVARILKIGLNNWANEKSATLVSATKASYETALVKRRALFPKLPANSE